MSKLLYIANARIPTEKANGLQIIKTCEALSKISDLQLIVPKRIQPKSVAIIDPFKFYSLKTKFKIIYLPSFDVLSYISKFPNWLQVILYFIQELTFAFSVKKQHYINSSVYTRSILIAFIMSHSASNKVIYEAHNFPSRYLSIVILKYILRRVNGIVTISHGLEKKYRRLDCQNIAVIPDGTDIFPKMIDKNILHSDYLIPKNYFVVAYAGKLEESKGIKTLIDALKDLNSVRVKLIIFGGNDVTINRWYKYSLNYAEKITFAGYVQHENLISYLSQADIFILPNSSKNIESREYTSPMKLFEYLALGKPIIASDTPANMEILENQRTALLFKADDSIDLARKIKLLLKDKKLSSYLVKNGLTCVEKFTWRNRARSILKFLNYI